MRHVEGDGMIRILEGWTKSATAGFGFVFVLVGEGVPRMNT